MARSFCYISKTNRFARTQIARCDAADHAIQHFRRQSCSGSPKGSVGRAEFLAPDDITQHHDAATGDLPHFQFCRRRPYRRRAERRMSRTNSARPLGERVVPFHPAELAEVLRMIDRDRLITLLARGSPA